MSLDKSSENDRPIWDGAFTIDHESKCIDMMMDNKKESDITYETTFQRYLT